MTVSRTSPTVVHRMRQAGKTVVQAHGAHSTFCTIGHVRHMQAARELGDVLVGHHHGRPLRQQGPRSPGLQREHPRRDAREPRNISTFVAINRDADAVGAIATIRPDVYVKGPDYEKAEDDVTGKIVGRARRAAEAHGGRIHFTHEVMFELDRGCSTGTSTSTTRWSPAISMPCCGNGGPSPRRSALIERVRDYRAGRWSATPSSTSTSTWSRWASRRRKA